MEEKTRQEIIDLGEDDFETRSATEIIEDELKERQDIERLEELRIKYSGDYAKVDKINKILLYQYSIE